MENVPEKVNNPGTEIEYKPLYDYVASVARSVPCLNQGSSPEEAREIARQKAAETAEIRKRMPARGGRAGY